MGAVWTGGAPPAKASPIRALCRAPEHLRQPPPRAAGGFRRQRIKREKAALGDHTPAGYQQRARFYTISDEGRLNFAKNVASHLSRYGWDVVIAPTAEEALELVAARPPDEIAVPLRAFVHRRRLGFRTEDALADLADDLAHPLADAAIAAIRLVIGGSAGAGRLYHTVSALAAVTRRLAELSRRAKDRVSLGLSPHAPYSVSGPLYARVALLAGDYGLPLAVHLAESPEESQLLEQASGGFAESWRRRGIPLPPLPGRTPVEWLDQHGVLGPGPCASTSCRRASWISTGWPGGGWRSPIARAPISGMATGSRRCGGCWPGASGSAWAPTRWPA